VKEELKKEIGNHLIVSLSLLVIVEFLWLTRGSFSWLKSGEFFLGLLGGTFLLDADHLIYWFFLYPQLGESKEARRLWQEKRWKELLNLLGQSHKTHVSLIFHHFLFQAILAVLALFVISSTANLLGKGLVLAALAHLWWDEAVDFRQNPHHLKTWLFARTPFARWPLPLAWLRYYLLFYLVVLGGFVYVIGSY